eukprot:5971299-Alexandrium_andersonii.AAC.2
MREQKRPLASEEPAGGARGAVAPPERLLRSCALALEQRHLEAGGACSSLSPRRRRTGSFLPPTARCLGPLASPVQGAVGAGRARAVSQR